MSSLTPSDVGWDIIGNKVIRYEGFTDDCWADVNGQGKMDSDLEEEIILDWSEREGTKGLNLVESGWLTPDIFYGIYDLS